MGSPPSNLITADYPCGVQKFNPAGNQDPADILTTEQVTSILANNVSLPINLTSQVTGILPVANYATGTPTGVKFVRDDGVLAVPATGGGGSVTSVSIVTANGISGSVSNPTTTPAATLVLGDITPTSVNSSGPIIGSNLIGVNTGDQNLSGLLVKAANLSDVSSVSTARSNLGLGSLATQSGTFSGTSSGTNTGDQTIVLTGDVTGSGAGSFTASLAASGVTAASYTYATITFDAKGRATAASNGVTPAILGANTFTNLQTIAQGSANTGIIASTGFSLTGSNTTSMVDFSGTWNTSGIATLLNFNVTDTASNSASLLLNLGVNGAGQFRVKKSGTAIVGNAGGAGGLQITDSGSTQPILTRQSDGGLVLGYNTGLPAIYIGSANLAICQAGTAIFQHGNVNSATPGAQTVTAQGSRATIDSNVAAPNFTIQAPTGTGNSTPAALVFKSPVAVASGTGAQTQTTGLTILAGTAVLTNYIVAGLPSAATAGSGATAFVTDASTTLILGLGGAVAGGGANKVPVYSDGTNWLYG